MKRRQIFLTTRSRRFLRACLCRRRMSQLYKGLLSPPFQKELQQSLSISEGFRHDETRCRMAAFASMLLLNPACLSPDLNLQALRGQTWKFPGSIEIN